MRLLYFYFCLTGATCERRWRWPMPKIWTVWHLVLSFCSDTSSCRWVIAVKQWTWSLLPCSSLQRFQTFTFSSGLLPFWKAIIYKYIFPKWRCFNWNNKIKNKPMIKNRSIPDVRRWRSGSRSVPNAQQLYSVAYEGQLCVASVRRTRPHNVDRTAARHVPSAGQCTNGQH